MLFTYSNLLEKIPGALKLILFSATPDVLIIHVTFLYKPCLSLIQQRSSKPRAPGSCVEFAVFIFDVTGWYR